MPYIDLMVHPTVTPEQAESLCRGITELMATVMGKRREVTAVRVAEAAACRWSIGGETPRGPTAYLDVKITAGSNGREQKAQLLRRLDALLRETLGGLEEASYIVIHELPAESWGYAGKSQAERLGAVR